MKEFKRIVQPNSWSCMAAVMCMITDTTIEEFIKHAGHDGSAYRKESTHEEKRTGFRFQECMRYLIDHDFYAGYLGYREGGYNLYHEDVMATGICPTIPTYIPAILCVESKGSPECLHVVLWTGEEILDPSPRAPERPHLKDYKISSWWVLNKIE